MKILFAALFLAPGLAFAQEAERDFGDLATGKFFTITQKRTTMKDSADISNFEIKVSPEKEEFIYKVNSVRTPRKFLKKNGDFKLTVERKEGKISRISNVDYSSKEDTTGEKFLSTSAIGADGKVDSITNCTQNYKFGWFNMKTDKSDQICVTVNKDICEYMDKNGIDKALYDKLKSCSDLFTKLDEHQKKLAELGKEDHASNMKALSKLDGQVGSVEMFYNLEAKTLKNVSLLTDGYAFGLSVCDFLKEKKYLREKKASDAAGTDDAKSSQQ